MSAQNHSQENDVILIAYDGSQPAKAGARLAVRTAAAMQKTIRGLYVVDTNLVFDPYNSTRAELGHPESGPDREENAVDDFQSYGRQELGWLDNLGREFGVPIDSEVVFGNTGKLLEEAASNAFMVAFGRRGRSRAEERNTLGRHFRQIANHISPPIIAGGDRQVKIRKGLLAYDMKEQTQHALAWALMMERALGIEMDAVSVVEPAQDAQAHIRQVHERLVTAGLPNSDVLTPVGDPAAEILKAIDQTKADLLVIGCNEMTNVLDWISGSTLDKVLRGSQVPALIAG